MSDALAYALRLLRDLRPLRHSGHTHAPTPSADYPPSWRAAIAALASYQATPLRSAEWDSDFRDLVERLAKLVPSQDRPPQRPRAKPVNLPYGSLGTLFKGREDLLADIHTGFAGESGHAQAIIAQHAIHGLGGIGKTRAAVEYAWRHGEDYSALLFLTAQSPEDLRTKLSALCDPLGLARGVTEEDERVRATLGWLADSANTGWRILCRLGESAAADRFTESDTTHWSTPSPRVNSAARSLYSRVAARLHA